MSCERPVALLRTELELAVRRPRSAEELTLAIRSALDETVRLSRLADDLLLLARAEEGSLPLRRERTELSELFAGVAARFANRARESGRHVRAVPTGDSVEGDPVRLEQALNNLVDNALTYGSGEVEIFAADPERLDRVACCGSRARVRRSILESSVRSIQSCRRGTRSSRRRARALDRATDRRRARGQCGCREPAARRGRCLARARPLRVRRAPASGFIPVSFPSATLVACPGQSKTVGTQSRRVMRGSFGFAASQGSRWRSWSPPAVRSRRSRQARPT